MKLTPTLEGTALNASPRSRSFSFATILQAVAMILTLSGVLFTSGCVGYAGKPGTTGGVSGLSMDVSPSSLDFGSLTVGQSASKILTITNSGTQPVTVSGISVTGSAFTMKPMPVPMALAVGQSATVSTTFTAAASGPVSGQIMISSNAPDSPVVVALTAAGVSKPSNLTVTPASVSFGDVKVGSESTQTVRLTNAGSSSMAISAVSASGTGISLSGPSFPVTLAAGASTSLNAMFKPTVAGNASGTLMISSDAANSPDAIGWSGTATDSSTLQLTASPASENFGTVSVGSSGSATVQLKNTGTASVNISAIAMSGSGFTLSSVNLPMTLAANQAATLTAGFKPTTSGQFSGHITVTSNATDSPTLVSLSGTGASAALSATPSSISFGTVPTGTSTTQTIRLSNLGESPLTISSVTASGSGLSLTGLTTPMNIAVGQNANLTVALRLSSAGAASGEITITSNAPGPPTQIAWSATAQASVVALASNPASLSFGNVSVGTTDTLQTTIKNIGNSNANISMISVSGTGFTLNGSGSAATLGPGQSLTLSVSFDPQAAASDSGQLTIASNASNPQLAVALAGSGVTKSTSGKHSVSLAWDASTSSVVGYYVYRGSQPSGPFARLNPSATASTSFSDSTVSGGEVYYYVVTAVNSSNIESTDSNQVSVTIP
jgi:Abnormal spindle-like microcephaly-assoc'd, ASPM-SPD-2-Hydin/Protein of unknown function (DUF1573)